MAIYYWPVVRSLLRFGWCGLAGGSAKLGRLRFSLQVCRATLLHGSLLLLTALGFVCLMVMAETREASQGLELELTHRHRSSSKSRAKEIHSQHWAHGRVKIKSQGKNWSHQQNLPLVIKSSLHCLDSSLPWPGLTPFALPKLLTLVCSSGIQFMDLGSLIETGQDWVISDTKL